MVNAVVLQASALCVPTLVCWAEGYLPHLSSRGDGLGFGSRCLLWASIVGALFVPLCGCYVR
jgi:hypothetical protein